MFVNASLKNGFEQAIVLLSILDSNHAALLFCKVGSATKFCYVHGLDDGFVCCCDASGLACQLVFHFVCFTFKFAGVL